MTDVLSQEEIDKLLTAINAGYDEPEDFRPRDDRRKIKIYDFKRPDKFSKEQIRTISIIHETYARQISNIISTYFRLAAHCHVALVDQLTYEEFIRSIPTPTTLAVIDVIPLGGVVLEIDPAVSHAMINRVFGGDGNDHKIQHELTEIERLVMRDTLAKTLKSLRDAWTTVASVEPEIKSIDTTPQFIQMVPPTEMTVLVTHEIRFGDVEGMMNICYPYITLETVMPKLNAQFWYSPKPKPVSKCAIDLSVVEIEMAAELFRKNYRIGDVGGWKAGDVLYARETDDLTECRLLIGDAVYYRAELNFSKEKRPMFYKQVKIIERCKPYKERLMEAPSKNAVSEALQDANIQISVELGRTRKLIKEILSMGEGTIVELDKLAGEPVDIFANNVRIAKGEVVVIDENFGVRIVELCQGKDTISESL